MSALVRELARIFIGAAGLYTLLFMAFFAIGLVLVLLGCNLDNVDHWLDQRAGWFDRIGTILFKALLAMILAGCVFVTGQVVADRLSVRSRLRQAKEHGSARAGGGERPRRGSARMVGNREGSAHGEKPMGWGAVVVAIIVGYFAYIGLVN